MNLISGKEYLPMKLIYVAHPYGGDPDNLENIEKID